MNKLRYRNATGAPRLDSPDLEALSTMPVGEFRRTLAQLAAATEGGPLIVSGFTSEVGNTNQKVLVNRGVAICNDVAGDGSLIFGQLLGEGQATMQTVLTGIAAGTVGIWCKFIYVDGAEANRAVWNPSARREEVQLIKTRAVADWRVQAAAVAPGDEWFQVAEVAWDGTSLDAGDIADTRPLFFEGQGSGGENPAATWTVPDFDRDTERGASDVALGNLRAWVMAVNKRLEEVGGRAWFARPAYGENLRSASGAILVTADSAKAAQVHKVLSATTSARAAELTLLVLTPSVGAGGLDQRDRVRFIPNGVSREVIDLDVSSGPSTWVGSNWRRVVEGGAELRRTAGDNVLITSSLLSAELRALKLSANNNSTKAIFDVANAGDRLRFVGCTFDANAAAAKNIAAIVKVSAAGALVEFVDCEFTGYDDGESLNTRAVQINAAAMVRFIDCKFSRLGTCIDVQDAGAYVGVKGCNFLNTCTSAIAGVAGASIDWSGNKVADGVLTGLFTGAEALNGNADNALRARVVVRPTYDELDAFVAATWKGENITSVTRIAAGVYVVKVNDANFGVAIAADPANFVIDVAPVARLGSEPLVLSTEDALIFVPYFDAGSPDEIRVRVLRSSNGDKVDAPFRLHVRGPIGGDWTAVVNNA